MFNDTEKHRSTRPNYWLASAVSGERLKAQGSASVVGAWRASKDSCLTEQHKQASSSSIQCEACRAAARRLLLNIHRLSEEADPASLLEPSELPAHDPLMPNAPTNASLMKLLTHLSLSISNILFILSVLLIVFTDTVAARHTLLIVGHSSNNVYKIALTEQLTRNFNNIQIDDSTDFLVLVKEGLSVQNDEFTQVYGGIEFRESNISRLILSQKGTDEMSLSQIGEFYRHIKNQNPMIVIELGEPTIQTRSLLVKGGLCWGQTKVNVLSPNTAYLCNEVYLSDISVIDPRNVESIGEYDDYRFKIREPQGTIWPCIFASATKTERRHKNKHVDIVNDEEVEDLVDKIMEDITQRTEELQETQNEPDDRLHTHKMHCKYRKSCYETGELPDIQRDDSILDRITGLFTNSIDDKPLEDQEIDLANLDKDDLDGDGIPDSEDDDVNLVPLKLKCKYRIGCYKDNNIPLSRTEEEKEEKRSILARSAPQAGKKRTLKDIAERTVKKVKEAEEKAAARPLPKAVVTERILDQIEEELSKKLNCKYRKSCYHTGTIPEIDASYHLPIISHYFSEEIQQSEGSKVEKEVDYEELEELDKKVYCKYRKSCYESGVKPVIEPEIQINSLRDLKELPDMIETRKLTIKERCKYRKSCYESEILPDLHAHQMERVIQKEVSSVIPTSETDLKVLCKYRKSCYQEIAESATVDTVKHIRKRRLIEKEVRKRALRRARLRRKLKIDMEDHQSYYRKPTRKEKKAERSTEIQEEPDEKAIKKTKKPTKINKAHVVQEPQQEPAATEESQMKKRKKSKKIKETESYRDEEPTSKNMKSALKDESELQETPKEQNIEDKPPKHKKMKRVTSEPEKTLDNEKRKEERIKNTKKKREVEPISEEISETEEEPVKEKKTKKRHIDKEAQPDKAENVNAVSDDDWKHSKKEKCKYRRSCYKTGETPKIDQTVSSLFTSFSQHVDSEYDRETNIKRSETDQKLDCKYRKSCYETGSLPDLTTNQEVIRHEFSEFSDGLTARKLKCKYRKSCYEDEGIDEGPDKVTEQEEARKPAIKTITREKATHSTKERKSAHKEQKDDDHDDADGSNDEEDSKMNYAAKEAITSHPREDDQKVDCKYRKSCYQGVQPRAKNEDHSGTIARTEVSPVRTKCNMYYLSCREQMGLPPKEKGPIGLSGRRLCRKKKE